MPLRKTSPIAFLGLGNMGAAMALRLLRAGYKVRVYDRTASRARKLIPHGAVVAASPREAAQDAQVVFAMVADDQASRDPPPVKWSIPMYGFIEEDRDAEKASQAGGDRCQASSG